MYSSSSKFSLLFHLKKQSLNSRETLQYSPAVSTGISGGTEDKISGRHLGVISGGSASALNLLLTLSPKTQPELEVYLLPGQVNSYGQLEGYRK